MTDSQIIQDLIAQVMEVAGQLNDLTTTEAKDQLVKIGAQALVRLDNNKQLLTNSIERM